MFDWLNMDPRKSQEWPLSGERGPPPVVYRIRRMMASTTDNTMESSTIDVIGK